MIKKIYFLLLVFIYPIITLGQDTLNLDSCRSRALLYNPTIKQQVKRTESADANIKAKKRDHYPTVDVGGNYTFLQKPVNVVIEENEFEGPRNLYKLEAPIIQNIYSGRAVHKSNKMAGLQKEFSVSITQNTEDYLLMETELAFWDAIYNKELVALSEKYKDVVNELVDVVRDKVETEITSKNDLMLVEVRQNEAELFMLKSINSYDVSIMELNRIMGLPLDESYYLSGDLGAVLMSYMEYSLDSVLQVRPDIVAQNKKIAIQETNAGLVKSQYLPTVGVGVIPTYGAPNTDIGADKPNYNTAFMAFMNIPIVRWGKRRQDVKKELLLADAASLELEDLVDKARLQINSSEYQLNESIKRIELTEASLQNAKENLDIIMDRYNEGLSSILEVLDAQLYWLRSYNDMLDSQLYYKYSLAYYKIAISEI